MKALYRKYRPVSLDEVVGQDSVVASLKQSLKQGKISHAYLFTGPRGCGKTTVARIFAHAVNQFKYELEDSYIDIIEIDAASNTGVDNIRDLREKAVIAPTTGKYKIYIIDEVHMLSKSAFNALLKILEEPPEHVIFIMATTDPQKIPVTITSRTQTYTFQLSPPEVMQAHLEKLAKAESIDITPEAISIIVRRGGGSFRDSISLLDQISTLSDQQITPEVINKALGLPQDETISGLLSSYQTGDSSAIIKAVKEVYALGLRPEIIVEELIQQIIDHPDPNLLPLLSKLPEVQPPFTEAKLLLALLPDSTIKPPSMQSTNFLASTPIPTSPTAAPNHPSPTTATSASAKTTSAPTEPIQASNPTTVQPSTPTPSAADFDWAAFLENIRPNNINLYKYLAAAKPRISGSTLHIYPHKKIAARILNAKNNKALIARFAAGLTPEIHDFSDEAQQDDPKIKQISDIMGGAQEIDNAGNPF